MTRVARGGASEGRDAGVGPVLFCLCMHFCEVCVSPLLEPLNCLLLVRHQKHAGAGDSNCAALTLINQSINQARDITQLLRTRRVGVDEHRTKQTARVREEVNEQRRAVSFHEA